MVCSQCERTVVKQDRGWQHDGSARCTGAFNIAKDVRDVEQAVKAMALSLLLLLALAVPAVAQVGAPFPLTTHDDVFHYRMSDAELALRAALKGQRFVVDAGTKIGVNGLEHTYTVNVRVPGDATPAMLDAAIVARLPVIMADLAKKIAPFTKVGSLPHTSGESALVFTNQSPGRYLRGRHVVGRSLLTLGLIERRTVYYDVLVGR